MKHFPHIKELHWLDSESANYNFETDCFQEDLTYCEKFNDGRRKEFLTGRSLVYQLMEKFKKSKEHIQIGSKKEPVFTLPFVASISHSKGFVIACANNQSIPIGIDTEHVNRVTENLYSKLFSSNEIELMASSDLSADVLFSAKEAFYKMQYPISQSYLDFLDVELIWEKDYLTPKYIKQDVLKVENTKIYFEFFDNKVLSLAIAKA